MPLDPLVLPRTAGRKPSKGKKRRNECRDCGGDLRHGKGERPEGARNRLCPDCFDRFAAGFFR